MSKLMRIFLLSLASVAFVLGIAMASFPNQLQQIAPFSDEKNSILVGQDQGGLKLENPDTHNDVDQLPQNLLVKSATLALDQEVSEPGEKELIDSILKASLERLNRQFPPGTRPVLRDAHPKAHGLVSAEFIVLDDIPEKLRYGVFKMPGTFDALIRFSAGNVEVQEDTVPQAAGMAIKLLGVEGEKLLESEKDATTQDFVMINFPTFFVRNLKDYELLHQQILNGQLEEFFKTRPAERKAIISMRSQPFFNPVQARYFSQTPYLLGSNAIKFSATPISQNSNRPPDIKGPDFLREAMKKQVGSEDVYYEFSIQLQADPVTMPVEDSLELWDETVSPFQRVALIRIPKQDIGANGRVEIAENLAFTPWHSLPEHRPLGSMNRSRLLIYNAVSEFRRKMNNVPLNEPEQIPW